MQPNHRESKSAAPDTAALIARLILGGCFVYMGLNKAVLHDPSGFLEALNNYKIISSPFLLNCIGSALPWFEIYCGLLLIAGVAVRGTALAVLAMLIPFTLLVLRRALAIAAEQHLGFCAVKFDCGCGSGVVPICHKLPENCGLILLALWLTTKPTGRFCLRFALFKPDTSPSATLSTDNAVHD